MDLVCFLMPYSVNSNVVAGGVYDGFAGHDATRAFATFDVKQIKDEHDDISDLTVADLEDALEWEARFRSKMT